MKKTLKHVTTLLLVMWVMGTIMFLAGENERGTAIEQIGVSIISLWLAYQFGRALYRNGLMITEEDCKDDDRW